jgi:hypothetical protein
MVICPIEGTKFGQKLMDDEIGKPLAHVRIKRNAKAEPKFRDKEKARGPHRKQVRVGISSDHSLPKIFRGNGHLTEVVAKVIHESVDGLRSVRHAARRIGEDGRISSNGAHIRLVLMRNTIIEMLPGSKGLPPSRGRWRAWRGSRKNRSRGARVAAGAYGMVNGEDWHAIGVQNTLGGVRMTPVRCRTGPVLQLPLRSTFGVHTERNEWQMVKKRIPTAGHQLLKLNLSSLKSKSERF